MSSRIIEKYPDLQQYISVFFPKIFLFPEEGQGEEKRRKSSQKVKQGRLSLCLLPLFCKKNKQCKIKKEGAPIRKGYKLLRFLSPASFLCRKIFFLSPNSSSKSSSLLFSASFPTSFSETSSTKKELILSFFVFSFFPVQG